MFNTTACSPFIGFGRVTSSGKTENIAGRQEDNNRLVRRKTSSGDRQIPSGRPDVGLYVHVT